jgi:DNA (cytosine-5)-methyltransferase 1
MSEMATGTARAYYNEFDPYAAQWLRNLIAERLIPNGDVDERSIVEVSPADLAGYTQCHFFAGIGGWALAARLAGWPDDRELWTGSPPCQPFSVAGKGKAQDDDRHLWPHYFRLIRACRPDVAMGEQVAAAVGKNWLDGVFSDLEGIGYACGAAVVPACAVDAPHRRDRLWFVARAGAVGDGIGAGLEGHAWHGGAAAGRAHAHRPTSAAGGSGHVADADGAGCQPRRGHDQADGYRHPAPAEGDAGRDRASAGAVADPAGERRPQPVEGLGFRCGATRGEWNAQADGAAGLGASHWHGAAWIVGHDGKARRVEPGIRLLAHGIPARVGRLRAYGNAIVPQVAAEVIGAYLDCYPTV